MNREFRWDYARDEYVWDAENRKYIDFTSGIFAANLGHRNEEIWSEMEYAERCYGIHTYTYRTKIREQYEAKLCEWTGYDEVALFTTGSEAVEAALRVMGKAYGIEGCFHGKTKGSREIPRLREEIVGRHLLGKNWIIEGYRGWDAYFWPDDLIERLKQNQEDGGLICFDEVQSGFGRTGRKFAYEWYGIKPDILVIGKGSHSGFPGSAILVRDVALLEPWKEDFSSTHGGNPLACAAGLATIEEFEKLNLIEEARRKGELLHGCLANLESKGFRFNGRGLVAAVLMDGSDSADRVVRLCRDKGLLVVHTGKSSVKIGPPLTIPDDVLLEGLDILKGVLDGISDRSVQAS